MVCPAALSKLQDEKAEVVDPENMLWVEQNQLCSECTKTKEICEGCVVCVKTASAAISVV